MEVLVLVTGAGLVYYALDAKSKNVGVDKSTPKYNSMQWAPGGGLRAQFMYEELQQPMNLSIRMPSEIDSTAAVTPTPEMRGVNWTSPMTDFRDARLAVAAFHARERVPLIGGPNAAGRNLDEPLRFIKLDMDRTPFNEIY